MGAITAISAAVNAQLPKGSVAPDFTLQDINGVTHHLYSYLDSGYTVILDQSAAWCGPCWSAHNSHVLENLTDHYGPNGTITAKKIKVIFIEGESTNTTAQLTGTSSGTSYATFSQGDWVTGTNYPIIDNASLNTPYNLSAFPTFTIICRDRLVVDAFAGYGPNMASESYWTNIIDGGCPNYAPSSTIDAKAVTYSGASYFICNPAPAVQFQNYSQTSNITSATVEVLNGTNVVATQNWTGNLAPYAVATVNFPAFSANQFMPYKFRVTVNGDSYVANNTSADSLFKVFSAGSAQGVSYSQDFESVANNSVPDNFGPSADGYSFVFGSSALIGKNGQQTKALVFDFFDMSTVGSATEIFAGGYKTDNATNPTLTFDVAYAQYQAENDKLEVLISTDCGATWTSVYNKAGSTLSTHAPFSTGQFFPSATGDWRTETINLNSYKSPNMLVKFKGTSAYGNLAWVDNVNINSTTSVVNINKDVTVNVYPNPAKENVNISFNLTEKSNVQVQILDATGRLVKDVANQTMGAGTQTLNVSTADLAAGIYNVKFQTESGSHIERLTVIK